MDIRLLVVQGKPLGKEIPVKVSRFLIGRSDECHLRPNSELVSRLHCEIMVSEDEVRMRDLESSNGTIVNGERITDEVIINDGDMVQVGPLGFLVAIQRAVNSALVPETSSNDAAADPAPATPATAPATGAFAGAAATGGRVDKLGSKEASHDDIHQWLLSDSRHQVPDSGSGVYGGETQTLNISALQDTKTDARSENTPPEGIPAGEAAGEAADEAAGDEVQLADGRKAKIGSNKQVIEKTREDTSRAASEILRRMMERRPDRR